MVWSGAHIQPKGLERITQKQNLFHSLFLESTKSACFGDLAIIIHQDCSLQIFLFAKCLFFVPKQIPTSWGSFLFSRWEITGHGLIKHRITLRGLSCDWPSVCPLAKMTFPLLLQKVEKKTFHTCYVNTLSSVFFFNILHRWGGGGGGRGGWWLCFGFFDVPDQKKKKIPVWNCDAWHCSVSQTNMSNPRRKV